MSAISGLSKWYGSFFSGCVDLAIAPYRVTLEAFASNRNNMTPKETMLGIGACLFLTFAAPVLPTITSITLTVAMFGMCMALASMMISYPFAIGIDIAETAPRGEGQNGFGVSY